MNSHGGGRPAQLLHAGDRVVDEFGNPLTVVEMLGAGGQGEVWSVRGGGIAVKAIQISGADTQERLRARLSAIRRFDLAGIPIARPLALLGGGRVGYTMELLSDMCGIGALIAVPNTEPVAVWHRRTGSLHRRLRLLGLAADALKRLHSRAVAYCDISPGNVLISRDSQHNQVWLIDPDNLTVESGASDPSVVTDGYGAPEVVSRVAGSNTLSDAFSFAVLAFHILVLTHPFVGDRAMRDASLRQKAYSGELPWIDDPIDTNRSSEGLPRELVLTKGLLALFRQTFEDGLTDPTARPAMDEWCNKLHQAAQFTIACPTCRATYYPFGTTCPWCNGLGPKVAICDVHALVPRHADFAALPAAVQTDRLDSILLAPAHPSVIRARNALVCLDQGPSIPEVNADDPVVEITWDGITTFTVRRMGRHDVWLLDPLGERSLALRPGELRHVPITEKDVWTVRFGRADQVHRFLRFAVPRTTSR